MKQIAAAAALLIAFSCAKDEPIGNVRISGNIAGLKKGAIIIRNDENTRTLDSIVINGDSNFSSGFDLDSPQMLRIYLDRGVSQNIDNSIDVFAEPGDIRLETTLERFYADARVSGSENHTLYLDYKKGGRRYTDQQLALTQKRLEAFRNNEPFDEIAGIEQSNKIEAKRSLYTIHFALNNKTKDVAPYVVLSDARGVSTKLLDSVMTSLSPEVANAKYGIMLRDFIEMKKKMAGQQK